MTPDQVLKELEASRAARPRRRRLLDGQEGELPAARRHPEVPVLQRGRVRAGHLQGPRADAPQPAPADRGHPDRRLRGRASRTRSSTSAASTRRRRTSSTPPSPRRTRAATSASDILGSGFRCTLVVHRGAGAYICGEETALLDSLEGKRGNPRLKPPFPANQGLYQGPTLINNVETLSNVPHIVEHGAEWFRSSAPRARPARRSCRCRATCSARATTRSSSGIPAREIIYGLAGGPSGGPAREGVVPRRLVGAGADRGAPRPALRLRAHGRGRVDARLRRDHRRRRLGADRRRSRCGWPSSTATSPAASACRAARARTGP